MLYFPKLSKCPKKQKRKNCKRQNHALRRKEKGDNVCLRLVKQEQNFCIAVRDWKPVLRRSAFLVDPNTACPVTIASLCSAFQALSINHALRRERKSYNVCLRLRQWAECFCWAMRAWKALRSAATVTGHEVSGGTERGRCAWKALRHRTGNYWKAEQSVTTVTRYAVLG